MGKYRKYTQEYRQEAVRLVVESGWPIAGFGYQRGEVVLRVWVPLATRSIRSR